jgi:hypothetical protein
LRYFFHLVLKGIATTYLTINQQHRYLKIVFLQW